MGIEDQITEISDKAEIILRQQVRRGIFRLIADSLGSFELTLLNSLGIDAEGRLLQIFVEESQKLLNEHKGDADADGTRSG